MAANEITRIAGILNGTTNYILTKMITENQSFDEALKNNNYIGSSSDPAAVNYTLACAYSESLEAGNQLLNFSGPIFDREISEIVGELQDAGVYTFTISSTFSGLLPLLAKLEDEWWFVQGMTEVRANYLKLSARMR